MTDSPQPPSRPPVSAGDGAGAPEAAPRLAASDVRQRLPRLLESLQQVIRGKTEALEVLVTALLAGGSVLMEDVPGVGKTTLARTLAASIDVDFHRIQFTPDLLPGDILGSSVYSPADGSFTFRQGPIFCSVLLADEINRASPRTQSALLEAMSEQHATIEGVRHELPAPFLVLATQNPVDFHGTYPLPEAQLDRFLVRLRPGYPDLETEVDILHAQAQAHPLDRTTAVLSRSDVLELQKLVREVHVDRSVSEYMVRIVQHTREDARLRLGVSPRGSLMLFRAAQAAAFLAGRDFVLPDDVRTLADHVLPHRIMLSSRAKYSGTTQEEIIHEAVAAVEVPV